MSKYKVGDKVIVDIPAYCTIHQRQGTVVKVRWKIEDIWSYEIFVPRTSRPNDKACDENTWYITECNLLPIPAEQLELFN